MGDADRCHIDPRATSSAGTGAGGRRGPSMTPEVLVIGAIRVLGSLPVLRWPLAGGLLAILVDLSDLLLRDTLDLGGVPDYQAFVKCAEPGYLWLVLIVGL